MKIKAVHLVETGQYIVDSVWGLRLEVDGVVLPPGQKAVVPAGAKVYAVKSRPAPVLRYESLDGDNGLSVAGYQAEHARLLAGSSETDDGVLKFPTLEQEFAFRKFCETFRPVFGEPGEDREEVELEIVEVRRDSGDPDIVSLWNHPKLSDRSCLYSVDRNTVERRAFVEACQKHGLEHDLPSHSHLRFAKVGGKYVFDDSYDAYRGPFIATLAECQQAKRDAIARVEAVLARHRAASSPAPIASLGHVVTEIRATLQQLRGVFPKQSSTGSLSGARKKLEDLLALLVKEAA